MLEFLLDILTAVFCGSCLVGLLGYLGGQLIFGSAALLVAIGAMWLLYVLRGD